jgi:BirA family biotin operon repressor/biotin-[acetyl-CoA-carboxylase] ligase
LHRAANNHAVLETGPSLGRALLALQNARGALTSEEWSAAAGVSAQAAVKLAEDLRALGVEVAGSHAEGWRLAGEADAPLPELLEPKIAETIFAGGLRHFARIGSTNAAAMQAGAQRFQGGRRLPEGGPPAPVVGECGENEGGPDLPSFGKSGDEKALRGAVWIADEQTAGRGRAGHTWQSRARDGIYLSALLRPRLAPADAIILSLAAGLAVVEAVHEVTGVWGDLRWPNDVLLGDRKFCGILTELSAQLAGDAAREVAGEAGRVRYVVVGVGLNVNNESFPPELEPIATSLRRELGRRVSRVELVAALLRALHREHVALDPASAQGGQMLNREGIAAARRQILRRFEQHSSYCCGAQVTVEEDGGYEGTTRGLDEQGFLRVETAEGLRTVLSGGVRKR